MALTKIILQNKLCEYKTMKYLRQNFQTSATNWNKTYRVVVVGGGTGGCSAAAKLTAKLGKGNVAVVEPSDIHYYQPMWTLVGGGMKTMNQSARPMQKVLPKGADWIKEKVTSFLPEKNQLVLSDGSQVGYDYLLVAMGIQVNFSQVKGLLDALETPGVCSNYSPFYAEKTFQSLQDFKGGNALFTHPATPIKCPGASQKVMYIADDFLTKNGLRDKSNIKFTSAIGVIFGIKKYADSLWKVAAKRNIDVHLNHNLIEVKSDTKEAVYVDTTSQKTITIPYDLIHVTPPMGPPDVLMNTKELVDSNGYLNINKSTLQHVKYPNVFGIGDCTNLPTSKTAAAIASQLGVLMKNMSKVFKGEMPFSEYDGYTSCPLVTGYSKCILAEFDYNGQPLETFPVDQGKERRTMFHLKKDMMPLLYWNAMLNGYWSGPTTLRKALHFGFTK